MMAYNISYFASDPRPALIQAIIFLAVYYFGLSYFLVNLPNRDIFTTAFNNIVTYPFGAAILFGLIGWICFRYIMDLKKALFKVESRTLIKNIWAWQLFPLFLSFGWIYYYYRMGIEGTNLWWVPPTAWAIFFAPHALTWYMTYNIILDVEKNGTDSQYMTITKESGLKTTDIQQKTGMTALSVTRVYLFFMFTTFSSFMSLYWVALFKTVWWALFNPELWATACAGLTIILFGLFHIWYTKTMEKNK
jgi:hypothetical protein